MTGEREAAERGQLLGPAGEVVFDYFKHFDVPRSIRLLKPRQMLSDAPILGFDPGVRDMTVAFMPPWDWSFVARPPFDLLRFVRLRFSRDPRRRKRAARMLRRVTCRTADPAA